MICKNEDLLGLANVLIDLELTKLFGLKFSISMPIVMQERGHNTTCEIAQYL